MTLALSDVESNVTAHEVKILNPCKTVDHKLTDFQGELKKRDNTDYEKIEKSIKKHGFSFPFFVWVNNGINYVLDGHGRLGALQRMVARGEQVPALPVVYVECKNEAEAKEILLKLNSHYGTMTADSVHEFLGDIKIDFNDIALPEGFLDLTIPFEEIKTTEEEETLETIEDAPADSQAGQVYELGPHRLLCGDATNKDDIQKLMQGIKADAVFTDPPYGMNLDSDYSSMKTNIQFSKDKGKCSGNKYEQGFVDDFKPELIKTVFENFGYCKEIFLWGADYFAELIENKNAGSWIVWDKRLEENADKGFGSNFELCWSKTRHKREIARVKWFGLFGTEQEFDKKRHHPTQKPTKLAIWFLDKWTKENNIIVDLYGGSGSTLIACAQLNRICYTMELDPHYCDVIRKRWTKWAKQNGVEIGSGGLE